MESWNADTSTLFATLSPLVGNGAAIAPSRGYACNRGDQVRSNDAGLSILSRGASLFSVWLAGCRESDSTYIGHIPRSQLPRRDSSVTSRAFDQRRGAQTS